MKKLAIILIAMAILIPSLIGIATYAQNQNNWLISLSPSTVYINQPTELKVYSYNAQYQLLYNVSCNITITNATDVIKFLKASGNPIIYRFNLPQAGSYNVQVFCNNSEGNSISKQFALTVLYPEIAVSYTNYWYYPLTVNVKTSYSYNNTPITFTFGNESITETLQKGEATFTSIGRLLAPSNFSITLFGRTTTYNVTPALPILSISAPSTVNSTENSTFSVNIISGGKILPINYPIILTISNCLTNATKPAFTNITYSLDTFPSINYNSCTIRANATVWKNETISAYDVVSVLPILIKPAFNYTNTTPYDYVFTASANLSADINASIILYENNSEIAKTPAFVSNKFGISDAVTFTPGTYDIMAELKTPYFSYEIGSAIITAPRYKMNVSLPSQIFAGQILKLPKNATYYTYSVGGNETVYVIYIPGNKTYMPFYGVFPVSFIYPSVIFSNGMVSVINGVAGANLSVFCADSNIKVLQVYLSSSNQSFSLNNMLACNSYYADYNMGSFFERFYESPSTKVMITGYAVAGAPFVLVPPSNEIKDVMIGNSYYTPGSNIELSAGIYTVNISFYNGSSVILPLEVIQPNISVYAYAVNGGWNIVVNAPPFVVVNVVFANGQVIQYSAGQYTSSVEPINAYWPYGKVNFYNYTIIQ